MEEKKSYKADLEHKRSTFLLLAYIVAIATVYVALEWNYTPSDESTFDYSAVTFNDIEEDIVLPPMPVPVQAPSAPREVKREILVIAPEEIETKVFEKEISAQPESKTEISDSDVPSSSTDPVYTTPEVLPEFPGGTAALLQYINRELKYPIYAKQYKLSGTVFCSFIINKDGSVSDVELVKGSHRVFNQEAIRVLSGMPHWRAGEIQRKTVRVKYTIPIYFKIQ